MTHFEKLLFCRGGNLSAHIIEPHILIKHRQLRRKNIQTKVSFAHAIYHTSKHFCACIGTFMCNRTPLLKGPEVDMEAHLFYYQPYVKHFYYFYYC